MTPRKGNNPFAPHLRPPPEPREHQRYCGTWNQGVQCKQPIRTGEPVCRSCQYAVAGHLMRSGEGRRWMAELLGHVVVTAAATAERQAKEAEAAARADDRRAAHKRDRAAAGVVYYIRTGEHQVKIGTTGRLDERIRELRTVNLRNLLAVEPGGFDLEHQRHEQFKAWRYRPRSEDFWDSTDLMDHIAAVVADHGDPKDFLRRAH